MAVIKDNQTAKLILRVENGTNESGSTRYAERSFEMNPALADADAYSIGTSLADLQTHPLGGVYTQQKSMLVEEG